MSITNLNGVRYTPQTLTSEQQAQARQNIGAAAEGGGGGTDEITEDNIYVITIYSNVNTSTTHTTVTKLYQNGTLYDGDLTATNLPIVKGKNVFVTTSGTAGGWEIADKNSDSVYNIVINGAINDFLMGTYNGHVNIIVKDSTYAGSNNLGRAQGDNVKYYVLSNKATGRWLQRGTTIFVDTLMTDRYGNFLLNPQWDGAQTNTGIAYVPKCRKAEFEAGMATKISSSAQLIDAMMHVRYYDLLTFDSKYNASIITF